MADLRRLPRRSTGHDTSIHEGISSVFVADEPHEEAERFQILPDGRCVVYDKDDHVLFTQKFSVEDPTQRHMWTNGTDGKLSIAWTTDESIVWYDGTSFEDRPIFSFSNSTAYRIYQTEVRQRTFLTQFCMKDIVPKRDKVFSRCSDSYIKLWSDAGKDYLTIPLNYGSEIEHREIARESVEFVKWLDTSVELHIKGGHRRSSPALTVPRTPTSRS